jgi:outer membrane lipoprotein carrier protein
MRRRHSLAQKLNGRPLVAVGHTEETLAVFVARATTDFRLRADRAPRRRGRAVSKNVRHFSLLALCVSALFGGMAGARAQDAGVSDERARQVALSVQAFYDQTKSVEAEFHQTYYNRLYDRYDRSQGTVKFQKPGKMRWDYAAPNGKIIVSNGKQLSIYEPGENKEPGQVFERALGANELPQALSFLTGGAKLVDEFTFRLLDAQQQGFVGNVIELLPRSKNPHYERLLFYVDSDPKRTGLVHRVLIVDESGNRNRLDFKSPKFNRAIDNKVFSWVAPKGTRKVTQ